MERETIDGKPFLVGYHTQECRTEPLANPICCRVKNAWLGIGYYFWTELEFAHYWGQDFKKSKTGAYNVYKTLLDVDNCINSVFSEEGYFYLRRKLEEALLYFENNGIAISLEQVHLFLNDNIWKELGVTGIIYDDKPTNPKGKSRVYSAIPDLYYKKRIQVVVFKLDHVLNFSVFLEKQT